MSEIWSGHVLRYSRRDQLSINYAFNRAELKPEIMLIDNFASSFHSWPNRDDNERDRAHRLASRFLSFPAARVRELEKHSQAERAQIAQLELENANLRNSLADLKQTQIAELELENANLRKSLADQKQTQIAELELKNENLRKLLENLKEKNFALDVKRRALKNELLKYDGRRLWKTISLRAFGKLKSFVFEDRNVENGIHGKETKREKALKYK